MSAVMPTPGSTAAPAATATPPLPAAADPIVHPEIVEASPADRLSQSRELMRDAMTAVDRPRQRLSATGEPATGGSMLDPLLDRALALPGVTILLDTLSSWWNHHPWRAVGTVAADAGRDIVAPIAKRHPVYLMLGAALFGAVLLRWGPWRWVVKRTLLAGFVPLLATRLAANVPLETWLSALAMLRRPKSAGVPRRP